MAIDIDVNIAILQKIKKQKNFREHFILDEHLLIIVSVGCHY